MDVKTHALGLVAVITYSWCCLSASGAGAQTAAISKWRLDVESVEKSLSEGKWKAVQRKANKLATDIRHEAWHDRGLKELLADVAMYQAVAYANLGKTEDAIWYWQVAQNIDHRIRNKSLDSYGSAAKLLREFPLRPLGKAPPSVQLVEQVYSKFKPAIPPTKWAPELLYNASIASERPGSVFVEFLVDRRGRARHPVMARSDIHPVLVYGVLVALRDLPAFEPAQFAGGSVDSLFDLGVPLRMSRWDQGGQAFTGEVQ